MLDFAIIDNDKTSVERTKRIIESAFAQFKETTRCTHFSNPLDFLSDYRAVFDLIVTEVELPHINGIEMMNNLRQVDNSVAVVFLTKNTQCAIQGYSVNALDFIDKSMSDSDIENRFARIYNFIMGAKYTDSLVVVQDGVYYKLALKDIKYIEVNRHVLTYHTSKGTIVTRGNLNEVEQKLIKHNFVRVYKSYLVNIKDIESVGQSTIRVGGDELLLSRKYKSDVIDAILRYINGNN